MEKFGADFLKNKYDLHNTEEVKSAAERTEIHRGEKVPQNTIDQIGNYLDRFNEILDREDPQKRERGLEAIKRLLHGKFVIKPEEIPEGYFENQQRIAREQGHGKIEISSEMREQLAEVIVADQESSLDKWIDYLSSRDATYPDWLKYYAIRSILGMGEFDKGKKQFTKRSNGTTKPFPDLNREALAYVLDAIEKKHKDKKEFAHFVANLNALGPEEKERFEKLIAGENFAKLYAWAIEQVTPASVEQLTVTEGQWVKYEQGSDHMPLVESLQGHGTGWCTAGESTAKTQLEAGDFYIYYSLDQDGNPSIPRAAIRMQGNTIAEVRGVASEQNLDPYISPVVQEKMKEFPDGAVYEKKAQDMKTLTIIENKTKKGQELSKTDLVFLYEINSPIEGFGYKRDPRVEELMVNRDLQKDMSVFFECVSEEIAHTLSEINENTKAYVGKLEPDIFQKLPEHLEHVYTSFPGEKIRREHIEIGGKTGEQLLAELEQAKINVSPQSEYMLKSSEFMLGQHVEDVTLICLSVADLGFSRNTTTDQIYQRAVDFGFELCPHGVGPEYRLKYQNQPMNESIVVGMKQITGSDRDPHVFNLWRTDNDLLLNDVWAEPDREWHPNYKFVFRLRKVEV